MRAAGGVAPMSENEPLAPFYWRNEPAGALGEAMVRYINGDTVTVRDVVFIRAYIRQWIAAAIWDQVAFGLKAVALENLRADVDGLTSVGAIYIWIARAEQWGFNPI